MDGRRHDWKFFYICLNPTYKGKPISIQLILLRGLRPKAGRLLRSTNLKFRLPVSFTPPSIPYKGRHSVQRRSRSSNGSSRKLTRHPPPSLSAAWCQLTWLPGPWPSSSPRIHPLSGRTGSLSCPPAAAPHIGRTRDSRRTRSPNMGDR